MNKLLVLGVLALSWAAVGCGGEPAKPSQAISGTYLGTAFQAKGSMAYFSGSTLSIDLVTEGEGCGKPSMGSNNVLHVDLGVPKDAKTGSPIDVTGGISSGGTTFGAVLFTLLENGDPNQRSMDLGPGQATIWIDEMGKVGGVVKGAAVGHGADLDVGGTFEAPICSGAY